MCIRLFSVSSIHLADMITLLLVKQARCKMETLDTQPQYNYNKARKKLLYNSLASIYFGMWSWTVCTIRLMSLVIG